MGLQITLKSDLCTYKGEGFGGSIDTDVTYDTYGLPYIPARRLKGLLRDAAEYIDVPKEAIDAIFGKTGSSSSGVLMLSNAYIANYAELSQALQKKKNGVLKASDIISLFTYTRAQTAIEGECAKKESLRLTRVIRQHSPLTGEELVFFAESECAGYGAQIKRICQALRNMGLMRTRGLGAVQCKWEECSTHTNHFSQALPENGRCRISYAVQLQNALMLSGASNEASLDYIAGVNVLGALARIYTKTHPENEEFDRLFLSGHVVFSNLYLMSASTSANTDKLERMVPVPLFVGKQKSMLQNKDGRIENMFEDHQNETVRPFKSGYILPEGEILKVCDVEMETVYHHARKPEPILYTQTCINEGQTFGGYLECDAQDIPLFFDLLDQDDLRFGRSKTAQYSKCKLIDIQASPLNDKRIKFQQGEQVILSLESDVTLLDEFGNSSVAMEPLKKALQEAMKSSDPPVLTAQSSLRFGSVTGYNARWNLRKPLIKVIKKGSMLVFPVPNNLECSRVFRFGARQFEGYGEARLYRMSEITKRFSPNLDNMEQQDSSDEPSETCTEFDKLFSLVEKEKAVKETQSNAIAFAQQKGEFLIQLTATFLGRLDLMLRQATDYKDFYNRVDNVKDKKRKKIVLNLMKEQDENDFWREYWHTVFLFGKYFLKEKELTE